MPESGAGELLAVTPEIPDKLYFRIGEVSQIVGVEPHVLRYWESEFEGLSPKKSSTGQRMFRRRDVELLLQIKHLLYERKFTILGARKALAEIPKSIAKKRPELRQEALFSRTDPLPAIRRELAEIIGLLSNDQLVKPL